MRPALVAALLLACAPGAAAPRATPTPTAPPPPPPAATTSWTLPAGLPITALFGPRAVVIDPTMALLVWSPEGTSTLAQGVSTTDVLAVASSEGVWAAWTTDAGQAVLQRSGAPPATPFTATAAACHQGGAACEVRVRALAAQGQTVELGGWYGVHSDQTAFRAWHARVGADGAVVELPVGPEHAWESAVTALAPAKAGAWAAGSVVKVGVEAASRVWVDRVGDAAPALVLDLPHPDVAPTLHAGPDRTTLVVPDDQARDGLWSLDIGADGTAAPPVRVQLTAARLPGTSVAVQSLDEGVLIGVLVDAGGPALLVHPAQTVHPLGTLRPVGLAGDGLGGWWVWGREEGERTALRRVGAR